MKKHRFLQGGWYRKVAFLLMLMVVIASLFVTTASAVSIQTEPYDTYTYWTAPGTKVNVSSAPMYEYDTTITGGTLGISTFTTPSDVFVDSKGLIYLTDKGNHRIVVINPDYTLNTVIDKINNKGKIETFSEPCATFVTENGDIYITDSLNKRIVITDIEGNLKSQLLLPVDDVIPETFDYKPEKIAVDSEGYVYILSNGSYYGAVLYGPDNQFIGFYGANSVKGSVLDIFGRIWNLYFVSDEQKENSDSVLPYCFTDITVDQKDFVYTATSPESVNVGNTGQLKKLSPGGTNVLKNKTKTHASSAESFNFSDGRGMKYASGAGWYGWRLNYINSMDVDSYGYMYSLCRTYGHVFIYDQECNQLSVFGGGLSAGGQKGTFMKPMNIQVNDANNDVLIVDELLNSLTIFKQTEYGALVKKAQQLTTDGDYIDAKPLWEEVLKYDRNSQLAYRGLGRAALIEKDYETTLHYAKLGFDQDTYSSAFTFVRNNYLADNFVWMFSIALVVIGALIFAFSYMRKKEKKLVTNVKLATMFQCIVHPFEGAKEVRYYNKGSAKLATVVMLLYFISAVVNDIYSGFMHNMFDKGNYNAFFAIFRTIGIVLLWTVVNWAMTTLFQGKGTMKHVYMVTCYALIPQIASNLSLTLLTNILTPEEALVLTAISTICNALTLITLCVGIMTVHEFGFFKFIVMTAVIILGMLICVFVIMMVFVLIQQLFTFIGTIYKEISYR